MIIHLIGNAHLRPAGLWSLDVGRDEVLATLRSAADRCDEYPEFKFTFGETWAYELVEAVDPKLFKRIRKLIKKGQWSVSHGMYSLIDPSQASEILWSRQLSYGHEFIRSRFGINPQVAVNFEAEYYPEWCLKLLLKAGYKGLVLKRTPENEDLPSIFRWVDDSGNELLCYVITPSYRTRSHELYGQIMESTEAGNLALGHALCFYGIGNHGGGPSKENIEYLKDHHESFESVELIFSTLEEFFNHALLMSDSFPEHRGGLGKPVICNWTRNSRLRKTQRLAESRLQACENFTENYPDKQILKEADEEIEQAWKAVMLTGSACFMDGWILPANYSEVDVLQKHALNIAEKWIYRFTRAWSRRQFEDSNFQQIAVLRSKASLAPVWVEWEPNLDGDRWGERLLFDLQESRVPIQFIETEREEAPSERILFPAKGSEEPSALFQMREPHLMMENTDISSRKEEVEVKALKTSLENKEVFIRMSPRSISRICPVDDHENNLLGRLGLTFSLFDDVRSGQQRIESFRELPFYAGIDSEGWDVGENGPLRATVINRGKLHDSPFEWYVNTYKGDVRIYHTFRIHFQEYGKLLQLSMQLDEPIEEWLNSVPFGEMRSSSSLQERSFFGWTHGQSANRSVGFLSDDLFSFSQDEQQLSFTLLRTPMSLSSDSGKKEVSMRSSLGNRDFGVHEFRFCIIPGVSREQMPKEWEDYVNKPAVMDRYEGMNRPPWQNSTPVHLQEVNEQRALGDGLMNHLPSAP